MNCPRGVTVELNRQAIYWVGRELRQRLGAYERNGLPTHQQSGKANREDRMRAGILGEAACLSYFVMPLRNLLTDGRLDGGTDLLIGDLSAQVKTALVPNPRYSYTPPHIPFRADVLIQAAITGKNIVRLVGWIPAAEYNAARRSIRLGGWLNFNGVTVSELHDIRLLASDRQPGVPF